LFIKPGDVVSALSV